MGILGLLGWLFNMAGGGRAACDPQFALSPSGNEIVFTAKGEGSWDLYRLNLSNHHVVRLANTPEEEGTPVMSPDGQEIVYSLIGTPGSASHLFVRALDGSRLRQLTADTKTFDWEPSFSNDGHYIAFARSFRRRPYSMGGWRWDQVEVCVMRRDGTDVRQITHGKYEQLGWPRFFPDERRILFWALVNNAFRLHIVDLRDGKITTVPGDRGADTDPAISPGGKTIVLVSDRAKEFQQELWLAQSDGTGAHQLTHGLSRSRQPLFTADGTQIFFLVDDRAGTGATGSELWKIRTDGTGPTRVAGPGLFKDPMHWKGDTSPHLVHPSKTAKK